MPTIYVAKSDALQAWASDVGLTPHVYKLGVAEGDAAAAVDDLNAEGQAGRVDWQLLAEEAVDDLDEAAAIARAKRKETLVDPLYYPQIKRAAGIFKVKFTNAENHFIVREALEGQQIKRLKITPAQIGTYLIRMAIGG
jgi:hypothetical protein